MDLIFVRHAEPIRVERETGVADPPLHERGIAQARALARWLSYERFDVIVQSPSRRAIETARPSAEAQGLVPATVDLLAEFEWGSSEYIPYEEMKALDDDRFAALRRGEPWDPAVDVGGFRDRTVEAVEQVIRENPGGRAMVVCHAGVINAYVGHVLGIETLLWFYPQYSSVTRVSASRRGDRGVISLNETAHLHRSFSPVP